MKYAPSPWPPRVGEIQVWRGVQHHRPQDQRPVGAIKFFSALIVKNMNANQVRQGWLAVVPPSIQVAPSGVWAVNPRAGTRL